MTKKTKCPTCSREVSNNNYKRHVSSCDGLYFTGPTRPKLSENKKPKSEAWYAAMTAKRGTTARNQFTKPADLGLSPPASPLRGREGPTKGRPLSDEHRKRISEGRIKFLRENPHLVPYKLNHYSKGRSYAEDYWKTILDSNNLVYEEQFQIGPYQLDFAFPEKKIDLEIDGDQHHLDPRVVESDKRRNVYLADLGWKTIRVKWSDYQKLVDKKAFVEYILNQLK
jgi:very-short-patch-repair endonuclease